MAQETTTSHIATPKYTNGSAHMTMTTLLAGENGAAWAGGFIQTAATGPVYKEKDLSGATQYDAWGTDKSLILGWDYYGPGGLIYFVDYGDNLTFRTMKDSNIVGVQSFTGQAKLIYNQGAVGAPTTAFDGDFTPGGDYFFGVFLTKVVTS